MSTLWKWSGVESGDTNTGGRYSRVLGVALLSLVLLLPSCSSRDKATDPSTVDPAFPPAELDLLRFTYTAGFDTQNAISDTNGLMMRSIFFASCQNGNEPTVTGSVVESGPNSGVFTWSSDPTDRLRVVLGTGETFEITFKTVDGDVGDLDCDDYVGFEDSHVADYTVTGPGASFRIQSQVGASSGTRTSHEQRVAGSMTLGGVVWTAEGTLSGESTFFVDISSGFSQSTHDFQISTVFTSGTTRVESSQRQTYEFSSGSSITLSEQSDAISATGTDGTITFTLVDVVYGWTDTPERDPIYTASGRVLRNGGEIGTFGVDSNTGQVGIVLTDGTVVEL